MRGLEITAGTGVPLTWSYDPEVDAGTLSFVPQAVTLAGGFEVPLRAGGPADMTVNFDEADQLCDLEVFGASTRLPQEYTEPAQSRLGTKARPVAVWRYDATTDVGVLELTDESGSTVVGVELLEEGVEALEVHLAGDHRVVKLVLTGVSRMLPDSYRPGRPSADGPSPQPNQSMRTSGGSRVVPLGPTKGRASGSGGAAPMEL